MNRRHIDITINHKDITNVLVNSTLGQLREPPYIWELEDTKEGQLVTYRLSCTLREEILIKFTLRDYIIHKPVTYWLYL